MYRTPYEEEMDAEAGAAYGDPRRCPRHPHVQTSSPDGLHDAPCGECEAESEREADDLRRSRAEEVVSEGCEPCPGDDGLSAFELSGFCPWEE